MIKEIICPVCNEIIKIDIQLDDSGEPTVFLIDSNKHSPTISELEKLGIEFGAKEVKQENEERKCLS